MPSNTYRSAMDTAIRLLAQRDHTRRELQWKLAKRGIADEVVQGVLTECEGLNYLDDTRAAQHYAGELQRKGYGCRHIRMALKKKGVNALTIEQTLADCNADDWEQAAADNAFQKKRRRFDREPDQRKRREKIYRFLHSRGFSSDVIWDVIHRWE